MKDKNEKPSVIAVCQNSRAGKPCLEPAQWAVGTWQFCDEHAKHWISVDGDENFFDLVVQGPIPGPFCNSGLGSARRIGQGALLEHCEKYDVNLLELEENDGIDEGTEVAAGTVTESL